MNRRAFLSGLIAAPAVIRVAPLMRIAPVPLPIMFGLGLSEIPDELIWRNNAKWVSLQPPGGWTGFHLDAGEWREAVRLANIDLTSELPSPLS